MAAIATAATATAVAVGDAVIGRLLVKSNIKPPRETFSVVRVVQLVKKPTKEIFCRAKGMDHCQQF